MMLLELAEGQPVRELAPGNTLLAQGAVGGDLFILESGRLVVERDGMKIASISTPGALLGEMSVLLDTPISATVWAEEHSRVRVIRDARKALENDPQLTFMIARLVASRLDATSAVLVELNREHKGQLVQGILSRIVSALHLPADGNYVPLTRDDLFGGAESVLPN